MEVWECKQVIDFDKSTTTMKEERNKTLRWINKISQSVYLSYRNDIIGIKGFNNSK